jgi:hypothetical protein
MESHTPTPAEGDDGLVMGLATPDPLEAGDWPGRKSRRTLRSRPGGGQPYLRAPGHQVPASPPHRRLLGPLGVGEGDVLCHGRVNHGRSFTTSSTLQHHSPGDSSDCDLQLHCRLAQVDSRLLAGATQFGTGATGATTRRHDTATTKPDPCHESVPPKGVRGY